MDNIVSLSKTDKSGPYKIGIRCQPPALTVLYKTGAKTRIKIMPVRFLNKVGDVSHIIREMKSHHLILEKIPNIRIEKMLRMLQETEKGNPLNAATEIIKTEYKIDPEENMNKLTDAELSKKKSIMETNFLKNQIKEGDENYQYDIEVDFEKEDKIDAGWDSNPDEEDKFWL